MICRQTPKAYESAFTEKAKKRAVTNAPRLPESPKKPQQRRRGSPKGSQSCRDQKKRTEVIHPYADSDTVFFSVMDESLAFIKVFSANQTIADGAPKVKRTMLPCDEGDRQITVPFRRPIW